jgi:hypothetical protein
MPPNLDAYWGHSIIEQLLFVFLSPSKGTLQILHAQRLHLGYSLLLKSGMQ